MLAAGTIRRIRQTLMATNLAPGALVAWRIAERQARRRLRFPVEATIRSPATSSSARPTPRRPGSAYRLWTTLKVPQGFSMTRALRLARCARSAPRRIASCRRSGCSRSASATCAARAWSPAARPTSSGQVLDTNIVELSDLDWRVLEPLKREFAVDEIGDNPWAGARRGSRALARRVRARRAVAERARRDRPLLDVPRAREAVDRRHARHALQRAVSLARARRAARSKRDARSAAITSSRTRTGARAGRSSRNVNIMAVAHGTDKALGARAQGGDRRASRSRSACRCRTRTCSGAGAARSSRRRSRRARTRVVRRSIGHAIRERCEAEARAPAIARPERFASSALSFVR